MRLFIQLLLSLFGDFIYICSISIKTTKKLEKNVAHSIASGKFKIDNLPWTTEIKAVAIAFNDMSTKIENIINRLNSTLENLTKKLSLDELTGLSLKTKF